MEVFLTGVCKNSSVVCPSSRSPRLRRRSLFSTLPLMVMLFLLSVSFTARCHATGPTSDDCLACHSDKTMTTKRGGRTVSLFVDPKKFAGSIHGSLQCTNCHADLDGKDLPHSTPLAKVNCGSCHSDEAQLYAKSLHGKAVARGDPLAPRCVTCHGNHDILPVKDPRSSVAAMKVPFVCGQCHREGTPVQRNRNIPEHDILANYTESIHGEGLLKKGLIVAANCASCHTAHSILPHTDPNSSINRRNIAATCTKCHANIEQVHRKIIRGELWEKQANSLPACVDCHQPHKVRNVFYSQGMADADCMRCHANASLKSADGRAMLVRVSEVADSRHAEGGLQPVPLRGERLAGAPLRDHHPPGGLHRLPRRNRTAISAQHPRPVACQGRPQRSVLQGLPRRPSRAGPAQPRIADLPHQRARSVRQVPPRGPEGRPALHR